MAFYVGQKVVCVDDNPEWPGPLIGESAPWPRQYIACGKIYTVRAVNVGHPLAPGLDCIRICGVRCMPGDTPLAACRFRPVVERKTDISIFTEMLNPANSKERVRERS